MFIIFHVWMHYSGNFVMSWFRNWFVWFLWSNSGFRWFQGSAYEISGVSDSSVTPKSVPLKSVWLDQFWLKLLPKLFPGTTFAAKIDLAGLILTAKTGLSHYTSGLPHNWSPWTKYGSHKWFPRTMHSCHTWSRKDHLWHLASPQLVLPSHG